MQLHAQNLHRAWSLSWSTLVLSRDIDAYMMHDIAFIAPYMHMLHSQNYDCGSSPSLGQLHPCGAISWQQDRAAEYLI